MLSMEERIKEMESEIASLKLTNLIILRDLQGPKIYKTIEANELIICDTNGKIYIKLFIKSEGACLELYDNKGRKRIEVATSEHFSSDKEWGDFNFDTGYLSFYDVKGKKRIELGTSIVNNNDELADISFYDEKGSCRANIGLDGDAPSLNITSHKKDSRINLSIVRHKDQEIPTISVTKGFASETGITLNVRDEGPELWLEKEMDSLFRVP
jgi:hypothetical protein